MVPEEIFIFYTGFDYVFVWRTKLPRVVPLSITFIDGVFFLFIPVFHAAEGYFEAGPLDTVGETVVIVYSQLVTA